VKVKAGMSLAQEQLSHDDKQFPRTSPLQYLALRAVTTLTFLVSQSHPTELPLSRSNTKVVSSEHVPTGAAVGDFTGALLGALVVLATGAAVGDFTGALLGALVVATGEGVVAVGGPMGAVDGEAEGLILDVGLLVGVILGSLLGLLVGLSEGNPLGSTEGSSLGLLEGLSEGMLLGAMEGSSEGMLLGAMEGSSDGN